MVPEVNGRNEEKFVANHGYVHDFLFWGALRPSEGQEYISFIKLLKGWL